MAIEIVKPEEIEKRSMEIITGELNGRTWPEPQFSIVKRCIHTSADFDYADNLVFSDNAAQIGVDAIRAGAHIVTDTKMAAAGINKKKLGAYGGQVHCFISEDDVVSEAKARGCRHRERAHSSGQALRADRRGQAEARTDHRCPSGVRQRRRVQGDDHGARRPVHRPDLLQGLSLSYQTGASCPYYHSFYHGIMLIWHQSQIYRA